MITLVLVLIAAAATAGETAWIELTPEARARLVTSDVRTAAGTTLVGLEIEMPPGTKTYWRVPGETGIPTEIDVSGSSGVTGATILFPFPVIDEGSYRDYVYYGHTVLPVELTLDGDAPVLDAQVVLGICSDICVPAKAQFSLPLSFAKADAGQGIRIRQALANAPLDWDGKADPFASISFDDGAQALAVGVGAAEIDWGSLIVDMGPAGAMFGAPQKSPDGSTVLLPLLGGDASGLVGKPVNLTFLTRDGPFETSRQIQAGPAKQ